MNCSSYRCIQYSQMLYVGLMHHYRVLCVLCTVINTHVTCPNRIGQTHDVRTCGRAIMHTWPPLAIAPQGRACSCEPSTTMSSRRADVRVSHTFTASSRHATHGEHTCALAWDATLGDTRCITGEQTGVLFAIACARLRLRVVFPREQVGPRNLVH